jgi:hypothetical protein
MGAVGFAQGVPTQAVPGLQVALDKFSNAGSIVIRQLSPVGYEPVDAAVAALANWLRRWRQHGQTSTHRPPPGDPDNPGFDYALRDHHEGVIALGYPNPGPSVTGHTPKGTPGTTYRAALGLPIGQRFRDGKVSWSSNANPTSGRFASPVILRPYRREDGRWAALIIFVDARRWPDDPGTHKPKAVYLDRHPRHVSRDLYDEMKRQTPDVFP